MTNVRASGEIDIRRPTDIVRRHFGDLTHHFQKRVHPDLDLVVHSADPGKAEFTQSVRVFGRERKNRVRLETTPAGSVVSTFIEGPDVGSVSTVEFLSTRADETHVTSSIVIPLSGPMALLGFLVRRKAANAIAKALREDRKDLEEGGYMAEAR